MMAIAAGLVILAAAGGGYAVFGRGKAPLVPPVTPVDDQTTVRHDSTPTVTVSNPPVNPGTTQQQQHTTPTTTPTTNPGTRPTNSGGVHDAVRMGDELDRQFDQIMDGSEATRLRIAVRAAEIYEYADLPTGVRAQAAANAGQAYLEVATAALAAGESAKEATNRQLGTDWMRKAARLDPKYQRNLQGPP